MSSERASFDSIYAHGFARVAAAVPHCRVADPAFNAERTSKLVQRGHERHAALVIFPELGLSCYAIDDLLHQQGLLAGVLEALARLCRDTAELAPVVVVGAPLEIDGGLYNAAVVIQGGRILGVVPKSYLPEYREYYEKRQFRAARDAVVSEIQLLGHTVPFGPDLLFCARDLPHFVLHVEVCEDVWVPIPPSTYGAMAGATVLANLSASNITIGKPEYRRLLCASQSAKTISAYLYTAAGVGESTNDMAWDGQALIYENGDLLAEAARFAEEEQLILADVDLDRIISDRTSSSGHGDSIHDHRDALRGFRRVEFELGAGDLSARVLPLSRTVERFPYVPADAASRDERCQEVYSIQVRGLATRLRATGIERVVIGVSGGLDSTHALTVCAKAMDRIGLPRSHVLAYTMPGFATSDRTLANARELMQALEVSSAEIDIRPSANQMLADLGHPAAQGEPVYDVTFENVQAGERTSHLFRLANLHRALVVGTGDLSELALGWSTYGVGDQMSHYNVNASVPKTLIQFLLRWAIATEMFNPEASQVLQAVLETEISPELIPSDGDRPRGDSERVVGPFELADFFLYYILRFGYRPSKVAFLAHHAWSDRQRGPWPDLFAEDRRSEYSLEEIRHWLAVFLDRFFRTSQFKRSALPNGPKVGSGGALSPRADWRAPSDASARAWLDELEAGVPKP